jgi:glycolate oxidase FAD binding subunit
MTSSVIDVEQHAARVRDAILTEGRVRVAGGCSKPALSAGATLPLPDLVGVLEYDPQEFTFTALAGTPVREIDRLLAEQGQALPFDPPLVEAGSTLGGTVASGLSGPGRLRYGGVRDFLIGVRFVSGEGELLTGGGKVVKNAAGFDLPKLMVGSLGRFGVLLELTFKVFPRPEEYATLEVRLPDLPTAVATLHRLARSALDLACLELEPPATLRLRLGGHRSPLEAPLERARTAAGGDSVILRGRDDEAVWRREREFAWVGAAHALVKVALAPTAVPALEAKLSADAPDVLRRYGVGGNVAYLGWPAGRDAQELDSLLMASGLSGVALSGTWRSPLLGVRRGQEFERRITRVLDPAGVFRIGGGLDDAA